jgi:hypothetical protein
VREARSEYGSSRNLTIPQQDHPANLELDELFDVLIVNLSESSDSIATLVSKLRSNLHKTAYLAILYSLPNGNSSTSTEPENDRPPTPEELLDTLRYEGYNSLVLVDPNVGDENERSHSRCLFGPLYEESKLQEQDKHVKVVTLESSIPKTEDIQQQLHIRGWDVTSMPFADVPPQSTVLVLDELLTPLLTSISTEQWDAVQELVTRQCRILWVTQGSLMNVTLGLGLGF